MRASAWCAALFGALAAAGCATRERDLVVLVPSADGHVGKVAVDDGRSTTVLDRADEAATVGTRGARTTQISEEEIHRVFGDALSAAPVRPRRFTLYFEEGTEALTAASQALLPEILADVRSRAAYEVEIVGHTDRVAGDDYNDRLSRRRAEFVRDWLSGNGVPVAAMSAVGRGERDPLVPTDDGVAEPRNRRVEITVR